MSDIVTDPTPTSPYAIKESLLSTSDDEDPSDSDFTNTPQSSNVPNSSGLINYYFLLLAVLVVVVLVGYYFYARRRRRKIARLRTRGQSALARDLEGWPGWRRGRWAGGDRERLEGLNERGEAPPPYMPRMPQEAMVREDVERGVPLQNLGESKPPDYHPDAAISR